MKFTQTSSGLFTIFWVCLIVSMTGFWKLRKDHHNFATKIMTTFLCNLVWLNLTRFSPVQHWFIRSQSKVFRHNMVAWCQWRLKGEGNKHVQKRQKRRDRVKLTTVFNYELWGIPGACAIKLFTVLIYGFSYQARVFVLGKPFEVGLMFMGKAGAYPSKAPFRCSTLG
jgi:hypothetical protein